MTDSERMDNLEEILLSYATTIHEKQLVVQKFPEDTSTVKDYVLALADGLQYGHWPWTDFTSKFKSGKE